MADNLEIFQIVVPTSGNVPENIKNAVMGAINSSPTVSGSFDIVTVIPLGGSRDSARYEVWVQAI